MAIAALRVCSDAVRIKFASREATMKTHEFTLVLTRDPDEAEADRLYGAFDDGTLATIAEAPQIRFRRQASSLEDALRSAIADVRSAGLEAARVQIEPEAAAQPA